MKRLYVVLVVLVSLTVSSTTLAVSRYAIIIGANNGVDSDGESPFEPLEHAEKEARKLKDSLIRWCDFDQDESRTILLLNPSISELSESVERLMDLMKQDRETIGGETIFAFFYTGHGLNGKLLLRDGPFSGDDISDIFLSVDADLKLGFFDACNSAKLLKTKGGITSAPNLNLAKHIPKGILTSKGSIWFLSSGPNQSSFEDDDLGGVFIHFFIEALENAQKTGPGITLEEIWKYTRERTIAHTLKQGYYQTPKIYYGDFEVTSSQIFSFPVERTSTLILSEPLEGEFLLNYGGGMTIPITKTIGQEEEFSIYPGETQFILTKKGKIVYQDRIVFEDHPVRIQDTPVPFENSPGTEWKQLESRTEHQKSVVKGMEYESTDMDLYAFAGIPRKGKLLGVRAELNGFKEDILMSNLLVSLAARFDWSWLSLGLSIGYGKRQITYQSWSCHIQVLKGELNLG